MLERRAAQPEPPQVLQAGGECEGRRMDSGRGWSGVISSLLRYVLHSALTFVGGVLPQTPPEVIRRQQVSGGGV